MAYGTKDDVALMLSAYGFVLSTTSEPNETNVKTFLTQHSAIIDSTLVSRGYTVPVTGTDATALTRFVVDMASYTAYIAAFGNDDLPTGVKVWKEMFEMILKMISEGNYQLSTQDPDKPRAGTLLPTSYFD